MPNWKTAAKRRWPKACWIAGSGRYASLAHCRELTIELFNSAPEAAKAKAQIDATGCGGRCYRQHEIIDLQS
jgi:hypothetical protein